ncbi:MAG: hypothetical protein Q9209_001710 [Squamulea sp. 1 TL-2023]
MTVKAVTPAAAAVVAPNEQPPAYTEGSSAPVPVHDLEAARPPRISITEEKSGLLPSPTTSIDANPANNTHPPSHNKILIPFTQKLSLSFPYTQQLASLSITESEWESFTSALCSAAALSGAQKAKAITAAVAAGVLVNPCLGVVLGIWIWRREGRKGVKEGVGKVLEEWNGFWEGRGIRVGLVTEGRDEEGTVEVERAEDEGRKFGGRGRGCGQRKGCGQRRGCVERKRKGCCWEDPGFKLLVERISEDERTEELEEKVEDLEKASIGIKVDEVEGRKE